MKLNRLCNNQLYLNYLNLNRILTNNQRLIYTSSCLLRKTHYDILGIDINASQSDIKKAYFAKSKEYHPDRHVTNKDADKKKSEKMFLNVQKAYELLSDPDLKEEYDKKMFGRVSSNYERRTPKKDIFETSSEFYKTYRRIKQQPSKRSKEQRHELVERAIIRNTFAYRRETHEFYDKLNKKQQEEQAQKHLQPYLFLVCLFVVMIIIMI